MTKAIPISVRNQVVRRDGRECRYCGHCTTLEVDPAQLALTCDHVVPRSAGGLSTVENLVVACYACNQAKGDALPEGRWVPRPVPASPVLIHLATARPLTQRLGDLMPTGAARLAKAHRVYPGEPGFIGPVNEQTLDF